jgi:hypothetical protein
LEQAGIGDAYCRKLNNAEDHIRRTLAYYQSQNKQYRKLYKFISVKDPSFIQFGLKITPITFYLKSSITSRT